MVTGHLEALIVSGVLDGDHFAFGGHVRVGSLLDEDSSGQLLALVADVSVLSGQDLVSGLVLGLVAAVISLLLVVLQDWDPSGGLLLLLLEVLLLLLLWLGSGLLLVLLGLSRLLVLLGLGLLLVLLGLLVVLLLVLLTLTVNGGGQKAQGDL